MPRYDNYQRLKNIENNKKKILIIPSWRMNIKGTIDKINYESIHSDTFILSEFFNFYNNLINDKTLLSIMRKYDYKGTLCLHPNYKSQWIDFNQNEIFSVVEKCDYQNLFRESSLLITDYSSIFFDFGYLKKPIIYAHFDYDDYRKSNYPKGYFDYKKDGFGPICKNLKCTIKQLILKIKKDCILEEKYLNRIKKFFFFADKKNNERIYNEIIMNKNKQLKLNDFSFYKYFIFISFIFIYKIINLI